MGWAYALAGRIVGIGALVDSVMVGRSAPAADIVRLFDPHGLPVALLVPPAIPADVMRARGTLFRGPDEVEGRFRRLMPIEGEHGEIYYIDAMRRNPRPLRPIDRRRLAMDIIERETRGALEPISSQTAMKGARDRAALGRDLPTLRLPEKLTKS